MLEEEAGTLGVSRWAAHIARKTWLRDPPGLVNAIEAALVLHHPGQSVINIDATRNYVASVRRRVNPVKEQHPLGWQYQAGEATLRHLGLATVRVEAKPGAPEQPCTPPLDPLEPWAAAAVARIADALARHGVDPAADSDGLYVNDRVVAMALHGASDDEIAAAADRLKDQYVARKEAPEEELPLAVEAQIEELIEDARYELRRREEKGE